MVMTGMIVIICFVTVGAQCGWFWILVNTRFVQIQNFRKKKENALKWSCLSFGWFISLQIELVQICRRPSFPRLRCVLVFLAQINTLGDKNPATNLVINLDEVDPDVAYSSVPYEKGFALLFYLEQLLGGPGKC